MSEVTAVSHPNSFKVMATSGQARRGVFQTNHGPIHTPLFMPVGTQGTVKSVLPQEVRKTGAQMLIANTYHLWLRPGAELISEHGGLHTFMKWDGAIATDSGGFQAFSLAERTKLSEDGFEFASHLDGSRHKLSPEESMRVQGLLGADIALQLDVCPPAGVPLSEVQSAVERTTRWAERCLAARSKGQALFGIIQGGLNVELRLSHAEALSQLPLDGLALGGFSVGEPPEQMHRALAGVVPHLDPTRPHYLMGVGTPQDLIRAMSVGVDIFDCVMPTRNARNGTVFTERGKIVIRNAKHREDQRTIEASCPCPTCSGGFSRAYLRHLFIAGEMLAYRLLTLHNLHYYATLTAQARQAIEEDSFTEWASERLRRMDQGNLLL